MAGIEFVAIKDEVLVARIISLAVKRRTAITVWLKNQTLKYETVFSSYLQTLRKLHLEKLPEGITSERFDELINAQGSQELLGSFEIQAVTFFFRTRYMGFNEQYGLKIAIPREFFKLQRRKQARMPFDRKAAPKLLLFDPLKEFPVDDLPKIQDFLPFRVLDVSVSGLSFAARPEQTELFTKGASLEELRFTINNFDITAKAKIAQITKLTNPDGSDFLKIGVLFTKIEERYSVHIAKFVQDETRKMFTVMM